MCGWHMLKGPYKLGNYILKLAAPQTPTIPSCGDVFYITVQDLRTYVLHGVY